MPARSLEHLSRMKAKLGRRPTMAQLNQPFTAIVLGWGGVLGSVVSFLFSGAILWALVRLYQDKIAYPTDRGVIWISIAFLSFFLAEALAGAIHFRGAATLNEIIENVPFLGFLFVYARLAISRREDVLRSVEIGAITGAFASCCVALVQSGFLSLTRVEGLSGNPGPFAVICALLYGISILAAARHGGRMRQVAALAAVAAAIPLILSGMRSLWPMLLVAPLLPMILFRSRPRTYKWESLLFAVAAAALIVFLTYELVQLRFEAAVQDLEDIQGGDYDNSLGQRLRLWGAGWELVREQPLFGHGPGYIEEQTAAEGRSEIGFSHFHNFLLNALVRSGVMGAAAVLAMFAVPVLIAWRRPKDEIATIGLGIMLVIVAAYLLSGSVGIMLGHDLLDAIFIYGMIVTTFLAIGEQMPAPAAKDGREETR